MWFYCWYFRCLIHNVWETSLYGVAQQVWPRCALDGDYWSKHGLQMEWLCPWCIIGSGLRKLIIKVSTAREAWKLTIACPYMSCGIHRCAGTVHLHTSRLTLAARNAVGIQRCYPPWTGKAPIPCRHTTCTDARYVAGSFWGIGWWWGANDTCIWTKKVELVEGYGLGTDLDGAFGHEVGMSIK